VRSFTAWCRSTCYLGHEASHIGKVVLQHLAGLLHTEAEVTLELRAKVSDGVSARTVLTAAETCRTLRFEVQEFKEAYRSTTTFLKIIRPLGE